MLEYLEICIFLKCIPSDRQMYPQGYMYPRLGTPSLQIGGVAIDSLLL